MSKEIKVALQFSLWVNGPVSDLRWEIDHCLGECSDGRHPFEVEMLQSALERIVASSIRYAVNVQAHKEFGKEPMVQVGPQSQASRASIEAEKLLRDLTVHCSRHEGRVVTAHVVDQALETDGATKWRVLCRDDRKPNGAPGDYVLGSRVFDDADAARAHAIGISPSRFPIVVEAHKAETVLGALNLKTDRWDR
jgi:hypothetical protein